MSAVVILRPEPTLAQKEAGNYRKRKLQWRGLTISIENEAGSHRRGVAADGTEWSRLLPFAYGYINRTMGVDGDQVDVFLGPDMERSETVYVVHQRTYGDWEKYDEDKCMVGFDSEDSARQAFLASYDDPRFLGPITAMPIEEFIRKARATKAAPAMIKAIPLLILKGYVAPYLRDGQIVRGYQGRSAKPRPAVQTDLFAAGGDPRRDALEALKARVTRYASGLSRAKDFEVTAMAGHPIGVEIGELSDEGMRRLAEAIVDQQIPAFVDSGAFGVFMRGLKREAVDGASIEGLDFNAILDRYDQLLELIAEKNDASVRDVFEDGVEPADVEAHYAQYEDDRMGRGAQANIPPPLLVMPDVVGDQIASLNLIAKHSDYVRAAAMFRGVSRPIIPIQRGPLPMAEVYRKLVDILGTDDFIVGVPSNAAAISPAEFTAFLIDARPRAVHILGALADSRLTPRLVSILDSGLANDIEVSADANPLRSIIIEKGQTAEGRRANLRLKLGVKARREELDGVIARAGGRDALRAEYEAADADKRRRLVGLLSDLTGDIEADVLRDYGLSAP